MRRAAALTAPWVMALALASSPFYDCVPSTPVRPIGTCFRLHAGPLPTTWLEIVLVLAILVGLVAFGGSLPLRNPYTWPALLVLVAATIGVAVAPDHRAALGLWKAYFVEPMLAALIIARLAAGRRAALILLGGLAVAGLLVAGFNLAAVGIALERHVDVVTHPPVALYRTPNAVPLFLVPLVAFALPIAGATESRRLRWCAGLFCLPAAAAIALSLSRGGWLGALAAVVVAVLLLTRRAWAAGAVIAVVAASFLIPGVRRRITVEFDPNSPDNSVQLRWALWRSTAAMLRHHPVFGAGLGGFQQTVAPYRVAGYRELVPDPHNLVLNWWSETGLLGLAAIVWVGVSSVRAALAGLNRDPWCRALSIGLLALLAAVVVHGLVDVPYFKNDLALEFWALLAIQAGALNPLPDN